MDQRIAVDAFQRRSHPERRIRRPAEKPRCLDHQKRAETLAAVQHAVADRRHQRCRPCGFAVKRFGAEQLVEAGFDVLAGALEAGGEFGL